MDVTHKVLGTHASLDMDIHFENIHFIIFILLLHGMVMDKLFYNIAWSMIEVLQDNLHATLII